MSRHKHSFLMLQYAEDAAKTDKPWELWELKGIEGEWIDLINHPVWANNYEYRRKPVKWSPVGGEWFIGCDDSVHNYPSRNDYKVFERPTKEQAERAAVEMRRFNRLLALRDELCGDDMVDFNDNKFKYYVYFNHADKSWHIDFNDEHEVIMPYFTSRESAQKACGMLNSGEVEL